MKYPSSDGIELAFTKRKSKLVSQARHSPANIWPAVRQINHTNNLLIQWNLRIEDTWGKWSLSLSRRLSLSQRLSLIMQNFSCNTYYANVCYSKTNQNNHYFSIHLLLVVFSQTIIIIIIISCMYVKNCIYSAITRSSHELWSVLSTGVANQQPCQQITPLTEHRLYVPGVL